MWVLFFHPASPYLYLPKTPATMRLLSLLILVALLLTVSGCLGFFSKKEETPEAANFIEVKVNEYAVKVPEYMKKVTNLNEEASLQFQNIFKETYVIIIGENKEEFIAAFRDLGEYDSTRSVVENYRDIQLLTTAERIDVIGQSKPEAAVINGLPAQFVQVDANVEGASKPISYFFTFIEGDENVYMIMAWTLAERKEKYRNTFTAMAKSFRLT